MRFTPLTVPEVAVSSAAGSFDINSAVVFLSDRQRLYMVFVLFVISPLRSILYIAKGLRKGNIQISFVSNELGEVSPVSF